MVKLRSKLSKEDGVAEKELWRALPARLFKVRKPMAHTTTTLTNQPLETTTIDE